MTEKEQPTDFEQAADEQRLLVDACRMLVALDDVIALRQHQGWYDAWDEERAQGGEYETGHHDPRFIDLHARSEALGNVLAIADRVAAAQARRRAEATEAPPAPPPMPPGAGPPTPPGSRPL